MTRTVKYSVTIEVTGEFDAEAVHGQLLEVLGRFEDDTEEEFGAEVTTTVASEVLP